MAFTQGRIRLCTAAEVAVSVLIPAPGELIITTDGGNGYVGDGLTQLQFLAAKF